MLKSKRGLVSDVVMQNERPDHFMAENLPAPAVLAAEIVEQLEAALEEFRSVEEVLGGQH